LLIINLNFLCSLETIHVDGTFEYCTKHFYQLFSIHGYKDNSYYVPLVFYQLQDEQKDTYTKTLKSINFYCSDNGLQFKPIKVTVDLRPLQEGIKHNMYVGWYRNYRTLREHEGEKFRL